MLDPSTERLIKTLFRELSARRNLWVAVAILVSSVALIFGIFFPKQYTSSASILVERNNIVGPLMDGVAEQTEVSYIASIVSELVLSRKLLADIAEKGGWVDELSTDAEREWAMEDVIASSDIVNRGRDIIRLSFTDVNPERAFMVTNMYVDWILKESRESKRQESLEAYNFIDSQVQQYQRKLVEAEVALRQFRERNLDALPESSREVGERAMSLRREAESLRLEIKSMQAQERSIREQLSGEAEVTGAISEQLELRSRLDELEQELSTLRLNYHDTYPDIVRLKGQIAEIQGRIARLSNLTGGNLGSAGGTNQEGLTLYEDLRTKLATAQTSRSSAQVRLQEIESMLELEIGRSQKIGEVEGSLSELTRDYEVNQDIYQDLLRRRERARVSMTMDQQEQGLVMSVQEPPAVPYTPSGLRFMHIALAGLLLSVLLPIGISAALVQFDPRIRMKEQFGHLNIPVLAVVSHMKSEGTKQTASRYAFVLGILTLAAMYCAAAWYKLMLGAQA